jgi:amino-acid N-acetyltransferase
MKIRKAVMRDVKHIHKLINGFAAEQVMLPRSLNEIYENVRDFFVFEDEDGLDAGVDKVGSQLGGVGAAAAQMPLIGACALHVLWEDLAEVKSLAVARALQKKGAGRALIERCLTEARQLGIKRVFSLTYVPGFFQHLGFREADKSSLPHKIWGDCLHCPKFPECDENAVIIDIDG